MNTQDLMVKVSDILENNGFKIDIPNGFNRQVYASKDGKLWKKQVAGYSHSDVFGYEIMIQRVGCRNGAGHDISVDIIILKNWKSIGTTVTKERVNINMSDKSIGNRVKKIMDVYDALDVEQEA